MSGMKSLVPTLVAVGWKNFFLDLRQDLDLSEDQSQQLYFIRGGFFASDEKLQKELDLARLNLNHDLGSDRVSMAQLDYDLHKISDLKEATSARHFRAILVAINVLNHQQHVQAGKWLKLRLEMLSGAKLNRGVSTSGGRTWKLPKEKKYRWPSDFTPQQLGWRAW